MCKRPSPGKYPYTKVDKITGNACALFVFIRSREDVSGYLIIYVWKMMENMVPNLTTESNQIRSYTSLRYGRRCVVPPVSNALSSRIRTLREGSFAVHGSRLFNILPQHIRNMTNVELPEFKKKLDEFLATIPDEPQSQGYTDIRRAESNSILHMVQTIGQE